MAAFFSTYVGAAGATRRNILDRFYGNVYDEVEGCNCFDCQEIRRKRMNGNAGSIVNHDIFEVLDNFQAEVTLDKQSLVVTKPGFVKLKSLYKNTGKWIVYFPKKMKISLRSLYKIGRIGSEIKIKDSKLKGIIKEDRLMYNQKWSYMGEFAFICGDEDYLPKKIETALIKHRTNLTSTEGAFSYIEDKGKISGKTVVIYDGGKIYFMDEALENLIEGKTTDINRTYLKDSFYEVFNAFKKVYYTMQATGSFAICGLKKVRGRYKLYLDPELYSIVFDKLKAADKVPFKASTRKILEGPSPVEFANRANARLAESGYSHIKIGACFPYRVTVSSPRYNYKERLSSDIVEKHTVYYPTITYDGKLIIGTGSDNGGWAVITFKGEELIMVHSAWCQRVTRWSKDVEGHVDMNYASWPLGDWIIGPYATKVGLKIKETPIVFNGRKAYSEIKRKNTILKLKKKLKADKLRPDRMAAAAKKKKAKEEDPW